MKSTSPLRRTSLFGERWQVGPLAPDGIYHRRARYAEGHDCGSAYIVMLPSRAPCQHPLRDVGGKEGCVVAPGMRREVGDGAHAIDPTGPTVRTPIARQGSSPDTRPDGFSWRLAAFYAAFFAFSGISMPFFPAWLQAKELDARATGSFLRSPCSCGSFPYPRPPA